MAKRLTGMYLGKEYTVDELRVMAMGAAAGMVVAGVERYVSQEIDVDTFVNMMRDGIIGLIEAREGSDTEVDIQWR